MQNVLKENAFECRVSSTLNNNVGNYGKKLMFDGNDETCWNSEAESPQWILLKFEKEQKLSVIEIQFQGGFAGKFCRLEGGSDSRNLKKIYEFFPDDNNTIQRFELDNSVEEKIFKITFDSSWDLFGRIIIYHLALFS